MDGGVFAIGEVSPNFTAVLDAPKMEVVSASNQWLTVMDGVVVNGTFFDGHGFPSVLHLMILILRADHFVKVLCYDSFWFQPHSASQLARQWYFPG